MSLREIDACLRAISKRKGTEYRMQAALHGVDLSEKKTIKTDFSDDAVEKAKKEIEATLARKQREAAQRGRQ